MLKDAEPERGDGELRDEVQRRVPGARVAHAHIPAAVQQRVHLRPDSVQGKQQPKRRPKQIINETLNKPLNETMN